VKHQTAMPATAKDQIEIAAALVRLYVFLSQYLDRCVDDVARASYPDSELEAHLTETRRRLLSILSVNPVVKKKLTEECDRILALGASCLKAGPGNAQLHERLAAERTVLTQKTLALSDLVAVFRALD
jgi:RecA/RadA recombinase